jgi:5-methyltetrahydrofolate--homocysteine methyltransferase
MRLARPAPAARTPAGKPNYCLADFVAGKASGVADYIGAFAVTAGLASSASPPTSAPTTTTTRSCSRPSPTASPKPPPNGCARVRKEFWAYAADETLSCDELIKEAYRGIRPAPATRPARTTP